jgi:hypothetical protein
MSSLFNGFSASRFLGFEQDQRTYWKLFERPLQQQHLLLIVVVLEPRLMKQCDLAATGLGAVFVCFLSKVDGAPNQGGCALSEDVVS